jgi:uncharacterized membrane protein YraQ (UPF0718 family)
VPVELYHPVALIIQSLYTGLMLFYKALWSILFGVAVTAGIDVFVDKERMARYLGGRNVKATGLAAVAGAVSSACTFGAVSIAQTLFKKGASAEATFAFALASTNIVFELSVLIFVLLGPAYVAAEFISGVLMVAVMYLLAHWTLPVDVFESSRKQLQLRESDFSFIRADKGPWWAQLRTVHGWYYVAKRYFRTLERIRTSIIVGFALSGFIIVLVPKAFWSALFLPSNTFYGIAENAAVGVLAGVFSFIGSIGIVPFAAALWLGGAGFAGVLGAIVSDNITVPVLGVWRNFYGDKATRYIFGLFYVTMVIASIAVTYVFRALHWIPAAPAALNLTAVHFRLDYTLILTSAFLLLTTSLWVVRFSVDRQGTIAQHT